MSLRVGADNPMINSGGGGGDAGGSGAGAVTFWEWYVRRGRIGRRTWWLGYTLPLGVLGLLAGWADVSLGYESALISVSEDGTVSALSGPISTTFGLLTLIPSVSALVCRLHDRGLAAYWALGVFIPVLGVIAVFVYCGFVRGSDQPNRYGPPVTVPAGPAGERPIGPDDPRWIPPDDRI